VLAQSEIYAAQAEVALREEDLINARSNMVQIRLVLAQMLNSPGGNALARDIVLDSVPVAPDFEPEDVQLHINLAMRLRPELNQAKLLLQRDALELVKTKNGLLPRMDLFATLGKSGFANSFDRSFRDIYDKDNYDALVGVTLEYPPENRAAQALNYRAIYTRQQDQEALNNLVQLIEVDVRSAHQELIRSHEQVSATRVSRKLQEEKLNVETEKFRVGTSTSLLVAQAERDYLTSQIAEVNAVVSNLNAFVELYKMDGSLLRRRGLACPGAEPVELAQNQAIKDVDNTKKQW
jgi:outer membrane protein TolC